MGERKSRGVIRVRAATALFPPAQVDPHLDAFMQRLHRQKVEAAVQQQPASDGAAAARAKAQTQVQMQQQQQSAPLTIRLSRPAAEKENDDEACSMSLDAAVSASSRPSTASSALAAVAEEEEAESPGEAARRRETAAAAAEARATASVSAAEAETVTMASHAVPEVEPATESAAGTVATAAVELMDEHYSTPTGEPPLLPPQAPEHHGRLVVCLDLDGTLVRCGGGGLGMLWACRAARTTPIA